MNHETSRNRRTRKILVWTAAALALAVLFTGCPQNPFFGLQPNPRDEEGPEVTIINPEEGQVLSGLLVITGVTTDKYQVSSVSIRIDSGDPIELEGTYNWYYALDTTTISEGSHTITVIAEDQFGNVSQTPVNFDVDQTVPSVFFDPDDANDLSAGNWNWISGTNYVLTGSASDDIGVDRVQVSFNGVNYSNATYDSGAETWSYTIADTATIFPTSDDTSPIYLRVIDSAGQLGTAQYPFYVVNTPPTFEFVNPTADKNIDGDDTFPANTLTVDVTANDQIASTDITEDAIDYIDVLIESTVSAFADITVDGTNAQTGTNQIDIDIFDIRDKGPADVTVTVYSRSNATAVPSYSETVSVSFDAEPPTIGGTITADSDSGAQTMDDDLTNEFINFTGETVLFEGTAAPGAAGDIDRGDVKLVAEDGTIVFDFVPMSSPPVAAGGAWQHTINFSTNDPNNNPYVDGVYDLVFRVTEDIASGGGIATATRTIRIDKTAQIVEITDPADGTFIGSSAAVPIIGEVGVSNGSPLASIEIEITDTSTTTPLPVATETFTAAAGWVGLADYSAGRFSYPWDNRAYPTGVDIEIVARGYDLAGNEGTSATTSVQIDSTAPSATFDSYDHPTNTGWGGTPGFDTFMNGNATITGTAEDNSGIASVEVQLNSGTFMDLGVSGGVSVPWSYTLPDLVEGEHDIVVRVTDDGVGNSTAAVIQTTKTLTFTVDNTVPSVTGLAAAIDPSVDGDDTDYLHGNLVNVTGDTSDGVAGVATVTVAVDEDLSTDSTTGGEDPEALTVSGTTSFLAEWDTELLPTLVGIPVIAQLGIGIEAIATDAAGNATRATTTVDVKPYVIRVTDGVSAITSANLGDTGLVIEGHNFSYTGGLEPTVTIGGGPIISTVDPLDGGPSAWDFGSVTFDLPSVFADIDASLSSGAVRVSYEGVDNADQANQADVELDLFDYATITGAVAGSIDPSLAFAGDTPKVSYSSGNNLYYFNGSTSTAGLETPPGTGGPVYQHSSVAYSADYQYIVYHALAGGQDKMDELRLLRSQDDFATTDLGPEYTIDGDLITLPGIEYASIAIDPTVATGLTVHLVYSDGVDVWYMKSTDGFTTIPAKTQIDGTATAGRWVALELDSGGNPHVVYYDDAGAVVFTANYGSNWTTPVEVDANNTGSYGLEGLDLAVSKTDGSIHVAYYDNDNGDLKYSTAPAGASTAGAFAAETVDAPNDVGMYSSIALNNDGLPQITYSVASAANPKPKYARLVSGVWEIIDIPEADLLTNDGTAPTSETETGKNSSNRVFSIYSTTGGLKRAIYLAPN